MTSTNPKDISTPESYLSQIRTQLNNRFKYLIAIRRNQAETQAIRIIHGFQQEEDEEEVVEVTWKSHGIIAG